MTKSPNRSTDILLQRLPWIHFHRKKPLWIHTSNRNNIWYRHAASKPLFSTVNHVVFAYKVILI